VAFGHGDVVALLFRDLVALLVAVAVGGPALLTVVGGALLLLLVGALLYIGRLTFLLVLVVAVLSVSSPALFPFWFLTNMVFLGLTLLEVILPTLMVAFVKMIVQMAKGG